jgi:hypothetical protein
MTIPTVAVLDSNGIIGLAKADCFPLLLGYGIAQEVYDEILCRLGET